MGQLGSKLLVDILDVDDILMREGYAPSVIILHERESSAWWLHPYKRDYVIKNPHELESGDFRLKLNRAIQLERLILQSRGREDLQVSTETNIRDGIETTYVAFSRK